MIFTLIFKSPWMGGEIWITAEFELWEHQNVIMHFLVFNACNGITRTCLHPVGISSYDGEDPICSFITLHPVLIEPDMCPSKILLSKEKYMWMRMLPEVHDLYRRMACGTPGKIYGYQSAWEMSLVGRCKDCLGDSLYFETFLFQSWNIYVAVVNPFRTWIILVTT